MINFFLEINLKEKHKKITNKVKIYFIGGFLFLLGIFLTSINIEFKFLCTILYLTGLLSDKKYLSSPNLRLFLQTFLVLLTIFFLDLKIDQTRLDILDHLLKNNIISILFTCLCILVLINGSNFIDGINCNLVLYYLIITILIIQINNDDFYLFASQKNLFIIMLFLSIILLLNFLGKIIAGDSGAYIISFFWGVNLIHISNNNLLISPFFIVLLLWYPAFENLFSIIRKIKLNKSALNADFKHLHQLIFLLINLKIKKKKLANNISGILINFYNLIIFLIAVNYFNQTEVMVFLILINVIIYIIFYYKILIFLKNYSKKQYYHF